MTGHAQPENVFTLRELLPEAEHGGYAVGSFAPRYTSLILPVLAAGQDAYSPLIVQISQNELGWYGVTPEEFAGEFYRALREASIRVPVVLHLDHTRDLLVIQRAIAAGFTSVMIDASSRDLESNIATTRTVVEYAHAYGVSVEAELGRIGTTDAIETERDEEMLTDPAEAERFVGETGVDALAVSVGTAHGVYRVRQPRIDYHRLRSIRARTPVHLVLHGGSGVPPEMTAQAIREGVSKVNIATDLEQAALAALGRETRMSNLEFADLPAGDLDRARQAVRATAGNKIDYFLGSAGKASR